MLWDQSCGFYCFLGIIVIGHPTKASGTTYIDTSTPTNITVLRADRIGLICRVENLGENEVIWKRVRDSQIMSIGTEVYVQDHRFAVQRYTGPSDWTLQIFSVEEMDHGTYECGISSRPDLSHRVNLTVVDPIVTMKGEADQYFRVGSEIKLICEVTLLKNKHHLTFWTHNKEYLNYKEGFKEMHSLTMLNETSSRSELTIRNATREHSGKYVCMATPCMDSVNVHVIENDYVPTSKKAEDTSRSTLSDFSESLTSFIMDLTEDLRSVREKADSFVDFISSLFSSEP